MRFEVSREPVAVGIAGRDGPPGARRHRPPGHGRLRGVPWNCRGLPRGRPSGHRLRHPPPVRKPWSFGYRGLSAPTFPSSSTQEDGAFMYRRGFGARRLRPSQRVWRLEFHRVASFMYRKGSGAPTWPLTGTRSFRVQGVGRHSRRRFDSPRQRKRPGCTGGLNTL